MQELECLQDHLDDLAVECRDIVGNLTELESEVSSLQLVEGKCPVSSLSFLLSSAVSRLLREQLLCRTKATLSDCLLALSRRVL